MSITALCEKYLRVFLRRLGREDRDLAALEPEKAAI